MFKRLVDDANLVVEVIPRNREYRDGRMMEVPDVVVGEQVSEVSTEDLHESEHTIEQVRKIADSVTSMIKWTKDTLTFDQNKKLPVLDLQLSLYDEGGVNLVAHEFFQKPMADKRFISQRSAMPQSMKEAILIQDGLRRCLNTSPELFDKYKDWYHGRIQHQNG